MFLLAPFVLVLFPSLLFSHTVLTAFTLLCFPIVLDSSYYFLMLTVFFFHPLFFVVLLIVSTPMCFSVNTNGNKDGIK